jgi:hypothetical protein
MLAAGHAAAAVLLQGESLFVRPPQPSSSLTVQLAPARDTPVMLLMKVLVGSRTSQVSRQRNRTAMAAAGTCIHTTGKQRWMVGKT